MSCASHSAPSFKTPEHRRTYQKVRRESRWGGNERWTPLSREHGNDMVLALSVYREKLRKPGQRWGAAGTISSGAVDLYRLLVNMAVRGGGRLEPSVAWLADKLNVAAKVIHSWKTQLQDHGFLTWQRRYVESGLSGRRGPQVKQISNAYALKTPPRAWEAIKKLIRRRPQAAKSGSLAGISSAPVSAKAKRLEAQQRAAKTALLEKLDTLGVHVALEAGKNQSADLEGT